MEHSTHPSFILRAEALIRFSTTKEFLLLHKKSGGSSLSTVDKLIKKDLKKYVSQDFDVRHNDVEDQLKMWSLIYFCVKDGDLTKDEQNIISRIFGVDKKAKLLKLIKNKSRAQVISTAKDKLEEAVRIFKETNKIIQKSQENFSTSLLPELIESLSLLICSSVSLIDLSKL